MCIVQVMSDLLGQSFKNNIPLLDCQAHHKVVLHIEPSIVGQHNFFCIYVAV